MRYDGDENSFFKLYVARAVKSCIVREVVLTFCCVLWGGEGGEKIVFGQIVGL